MKFTCAKEDLAKAVSLASRAVSRLSGDITECILFECGEEELTLKATDTAFSIKVQIPARVWDKGEFAVAAKSLYDMVSKFPNSDVSFELKGRQAEMKCLSSKVKLNIMDSNEFPDLENDESSFETTVKLPQNVFREMIDTTIFAAATSEDKPILTGLYFDAEPDYLTLVGLDGFRMAVRKSEAICDAPAHCTVPGRALKEAARSLGDTEENVKIVISDAMITFEWQGIKIYSRLLEGDYVNYKKLIPEDFLTSTRAETETLKEAIERASVVARDSNNVVTLKIDEKKMNITSKSELSSIDEDIDVINSGNDIRIGFNTRYILDVLKNISEREIELKFNSPITPCVVKKTGAQSYTYLILPVQLRD